LVAAAIFLFTATKALSIAVTNLILFLFIFLTHYRPAMPFGNRKKYFRGSSQFGIVTIKIKYHPSGKLKFNKLAGLLTLTQNVSALTLTR